MYTGLPYSLLSCTAPSRVVTYRCQLRLLERFHQRCLRTILNIHWSEFVTNVEVVEQAKLTSIEAMLLKSQLRWVGHVSRMEDHRLPKIALYGELSSGHRNIGAPKKRYKDTLKKALGACDIDHHQWTTLAADRDTWRQTIHQAVSSVEENRMDILKEKRHRRKTRVASVSIPDLHLQPLQPDMPLPHRLYQPRACLQATWTTPFLIFVREATP